MAEDPEVGREMHAGSEVGEVDEVTERELVVTGEGVAGRFSSFTDRVVVDADGQEIGRLSRCTGEVCVITPTPGVWERLTEKYGTERLAVNGGDLVAAGDHLELAWTLDEVLSVEYEGGEEAASDEGATEPQYGDEAFQG